ncbi:UNVERIFIED_CONTAM: Carotenoid 9,10(9',10')-cleavage dioxygenase, partial [Sesamum calycinum]
MIHGLRIKDGKATYVSRFVKTSRLKQEDFYGGSKFMKIGDLKGMFGLIMVNMQMLRAKLKVLDVSYGVGTANTALIYHHGKLLALSEADKPYAIKVLEDGDLQTIGMLDYDKRLSHSFTAHPKVDPFTGEMFTFGYSHTPPYITYRVISKEGVMQDPVPITVPDPIMMHDFAITENYAVFMDLPLYFRPKEMVKDSKFIFSFDPTKKARFGILPRYTKNELLIRWFELPNCFIFHNDAIKVLEDGDLQTIGMLDYDKRLAHTFTAHPKVDPFTGEMFAFGYSQTPPYVTYRVISKEGVMEDPVPITIADPIMMHDFAITENYAIFMDLPLYFRPENLPGEMPKNSSNNGAFENFDVKLLLSLEMVKEKKLMFTFDPTKKARFGVLPRYAKNELLIRWFELPNCFIFHNANAWEEGDEVVLITCRIQNPDLDMFRSSVKEFTDELYEMRFNLKNGLASQKRLSVSGVDFPRKQRYVYGTILGSAAKLTGIIKFDLHAEPETGKEKLEVGGNITGIFDLGPGKFGSEAVFVPRQPGTASDEDDGYLIFFVHDEHWSAVNVIDAKTMSADPVAVVELPKRVPYGFHAFL